MSPKRLGLRQPEQIRAEGEELADADPPAAPALAEPGPLEALPSLRTLSKGARSVGGSRAKAHTHTHSHIHTMTAARQPLKHTRSNLRCREHPCSLQITTSPTLQQHSLPSKVKQAFDNIALDVCFLTCWQNETLMKILYFPQAMARK